MIALKHESSSMFSKEDIGKLRNKVTGSVLLPGTKEYDAARRLWNAAQDKHPALIVCAEVTADVIEAVKFARAHGLPLSPKGGGHHLAGTAIADGGLTIDFSQFNQVRVDPANCRAFIGPGAQWCDLYRDAGAHGLATTGGQVSTVGIAGFTLGGGIGWLARKHGLASDNLVSAEVVTAEGEVLRVSEKEHPDLLWALRGGGGNFGVVTEFELALHPAALVVAGMVVHPSAAARSLLTFFRDFAQDAPDELSMMAVLAELPGLGPVAAVAVCYAGDVAEGARVLEPLRKFGSPAVDNIAPVPYLAFQGMFDHSGEMGLYHYEQAGYVRESGLTDEGIEKVLEAITRAKSPGAQVHVMQLGGAMARIAPEASAYPHRREPFMVHFISGWDEANERVAQGEREWVDSSLLAMKDDLTEGRYVNFLPDTSEESVRAAYGANYDRLAEIKAKYDPDNFFRSNHNIIPKAE
jgi:hypothetical protein